jgi:hypothetical protein
MRWTPRRGSSRKSITEIKGYSVRYLTAAEKERIVKASDDLTEKTLAKRK